MLERDYYNENRSESDYREAWQIIWRNTILEIIRNPIVMRFTLFGALFLLICAVDLVTWVQLSLLALVFGVLVYLQIDYRDRKASHEHTCMLLGTKYVIHIKEVMHEAYTGETQKL